MNPFIFYLPVLSANAGLFVGRHRIRFKNVSDFSVLPDFDSPSHYTIEGKGIIIEKTEKDIANKFYYIYIEIVDNPIPVMVLVVGVMVLLGLSLTVMVFDRIERVIDSTHLGELVSTVAQSPVFIVGIILLIGIFAVKPLLKK